MIFGINVVERVTFRASGVEQVIPCAREAETLPFVAASLQSGHGFDTSWLSVNRAERSSRDAADAASVPFTIAVQLVVEFYSQRV